VLKNQPLFFRFIESKRHIVNADDAITPFGRLRLANSLLYGFAGYKPPFSSTFHNSVFTISNAVDRPLSIPLQKIKLCLLHSQQQLLDAIKKVLPRDTDLLTLPLHQIWDDYSASPLHLQSHNLTILQPHLTSCWTGVLHGHLPSGKRLMGDLGLNHAEVDQWLDDCTHCLSLACAPIFLSTGGANSVFLRHQQYAGQGRSIFLLKDGILAFTDPFLHLNSNMRLKLTTFTHELSQYLLLLLLVVIPVSTYMRSSRGQNHPLASTHVWVTYHRHTNGSGNRWLFNEAQINAGLQAVSQEFCGLSLTFRQLYHMVFGALRKEFPGLFEKLGQDFLSPVDDAAQHHYLTGIANYGRLSIFPKSQYLIGDQPWRNMAICQLWQASLGCTPVKDALKELAENSNLFTSLTLHEDVVFQNARDQVLSTYQILSLPAKERSAHTNHIIQSSPFLNGIKVRTFWISDDSAWDLLTTD
jgi:hypothetical protein